MRWTNKSLSDCSPIPAGFHVAAALGQAIRYIMVVTQKPDPSVPYNLLRLLICLMGR